MQDSGNNLCAEVVHVGQLVPCIVLRVDDDSREGKVNKRVWLSLRLSLLYKGLALDGLQEGMVIFNHPILDVLHKLLGQKNINIVWLFHCAPLSLIFLYYNSQPF